MSKEFKIPQYTPLQLNSNIAYGLTKENNISKDELDSVQWLCEAYEHQIKQIADLEAKESVNQMYKATLSLKDSDFSDLVREDVGLKQQLAEKEKEIERLREINLDVPIKQIQFHHNQDKISFAVEKLKEVKKLLEKEYHYDVEESDFAVIYEDDVDNIFDNQIKQLKEGK